jgi:UDP-N-acetyl-D-galactosamine dehydrogenase
MGAHVVEQVIRLMTRKRVPVVDSRVLVMGLAFKENCPDFRNTRVVDIVEALQGYHVQVDVHDPWIEPASSAPLSPCVCSPVATRSSASTTSTTITTWA